MIWVKWIKHLTKKNVIPTVGGGQTFQNNACGLEPNTRRNQIRNKLRGDVSTSASLNSAGSPQSLAFNWLVDNDDFVVCPDDDKLIQRYVMAVFYFSTEGDSWTECSEDGGCPGTNFLEGTHECDWFGLTCNADKCITQIVFGEFIAIFTFLFAFFGTK